MEPQVSLGVTCRCQDPNLMKRIVTKCWCKQYDESSKPLKSLAHIVRKPYYKIIGKWSEKREREIDWRRKK